MKGADISSKMERLSKVGRMETCEIRFTCMREFTVGNNLLQM